MNLKKSLIIALAKNEKTGKELAENIGVTEGTITNMKQGRNQNMETVKKIAEYFEMSVSEFIALGE